jgi:hypothetical protein
MTYIGEMAEHGEGGNQRTVFREMRLHHWMEFPTPQALLQLSPPAIEEVLGRWIEAEVRKRPVVLDRANALRVERIKATEQLIDTTFG